MAVFGVFLAVMEDVRDMMLGGREASGAASSSSQDNHGPTRSAPHSEDGSILCSF
jgi:hypothetical protein